MWKPGQNYHSLHSKSSDEIGYPNMDFEEWYQVGISCYGANLTKALRKQALRKVIERWKAKGKPVEMWHLRAFVYGSLGLSDGPDYREAYVDRNYQWPTPPDPSWALMVCVYPDRSIDLDLVHSVSRRFWSEDNNFFELPNHHFSAYWYEEMGFDVIQMSPMMQVSVGQGKSHLSIV